MAPAAPVVEAAPAMPAVPAAEPVVAAPAAPAEPVVAAPAAPVVEAAPAMPAAPAAEPVVAAPAQPAVVPVITVEKPEEDLDKLISEATKEAASVKPDKPKEFAKLKEVSSPAAIPQTKLEGSLADMMGEEELRRKGMEAHARDSLDEAKKALKEHQYERAIQYYSEAYNNFRRPEAEPSRRQAQRGIADSYYLWAMSLQRQGSVTNAYEKAVEAAKIGHPNGDSFAAELKQEMTQGPKKPLDTGRRPSVFQQPELKAKEKGVADLMKDGREYMQAREYDKAQGRFEAVLKQDPYNTEAIRLLQKTNQKKYDTATMELDATRNDIMAETRKTWNPRDYALITDTQKTMDMGGSKKKIEDKRQKILDKMANIIIPEIDFRQANINDVVDELRKLSEEFDRPASADERKGVNIILNLGTGRGAGAGAAAGDPAAAVPIDPFAIAPAAAGAGAVAGAAGDVNLVTFSARGISLLEALKIVTNVTKLKYRIEGNIVMIVPLNAAEGDIVVRMYDVMNIEGAVTKLSPELQPGLAGGAFGGGAAAAAPADEGTGSGEAELKEFFKSLGVMWPEGSSIRYVKSIGKLIVGNTEENLIQLEKALEVLNVVPNQIEIEARFVEVGQTDMTSTGLEWLLTDDWEIAQKKTSAGMPWASKQSIKAKAGAFTKGNRTATSLDMGGSGATVADDLLTIGGVLTNPELSVVLHLLEQKGFADLLSAPKVTAKAGQEATIKVVTEYIYPTQFTVTPITGVGINGQATIVGGVVEPGNFETREVGVLLTVTPSVSPEGQMIDLTMAPEVVTDPIWHEYGSTYTSPDGSTQQLTMQQPFFHSRKVSTSISIYNGSTVVMGGMITEARSTVDDKVPFLGDLPVMGRLFRSKADRSEKKNLLIFVTARLVDPAGKPVKASTDLAQKMVEGSSKAAEATAGN
ncbi:MAG: hypothetical protein A2283_23055 [Lentisphaerae bacterium RIFOXYA12_FULL_48_11]|nr:MAG: hypothetical protein A2283_23055 [Lentisphaerae bacterium RIFOXYA12_FULL_48_11]